MQAQIMRVERGGKPKLYMNLERTSLQGAVAQLDAAAVLECEQRDDTDSVMNGNYGFGRTKHYRRHLLGEGYRTLVTFYLTFFKELPEDLELFKREPYGGC